MTPSPPPRLLRRFHKWIRDSSSLIPIPCGDDDNEALILCPCNCMTARSDDSSLHFHPPRQKLERARQVRLTIHRCIIRECKRMWRGLGGRYTDSPISHRLCPLNGGPFFWRSPRVCSFVYSESRSLRNRLIKKLKLDILSLLKRLRELRA